jgi:hypothetical protein
MSRHVISSDEIVKIIEECIDSEALSEADDPVQQGQENMSQFLIDNEDKEFSANESRKIIMDAAKHYSLINKGAAKKFYCWYDALSGQLRTSAVSATQESLPFRCKIEQTTNIDRIAQDVVSEVSSLYKSGELLVYVAPINSTSK